MDKTTNIVKKLKLIGQPMEIFKKTAFIKVIDDKINGEEGGGGGLFTGN